MSLFSPPKTPRGHGDVPICCALDGVLLKAATHALQIWLPCSYPGPCSKCLSVCCNGITWSLHLVDQHWGSEWPVKFLHCLKATAPGSIWGNYPCVSIHDPLVGAGPCAFWLELKSAQTSEVGVRHKAVAVQGTWCFLRRWHQSWGGTQCSLFQVQTQEDSRKIFKKVYTRMFPATKG